MQNIDAFDLDKWIQSIETQLRVQEIEKNKKKESTITKGVNVYFGPQICRLNPKYDNNKSIKAWMKQCEKASKIAKQQSVQMPTAQKHATFVFDNIFNSK